MEIFVVGGSASKVGKTKLACYLISRAAQRGRVAGLKVSTHLSRGTCEVSAYAEPSRHGEVHDTDRYLAAGASVALLLGADVADFRAHLAAGLRVARRLRPDTLVIESTMAGAELTVAHDSWFVAGTRPWKPSAGKHFERAGHVVKPDDLDDFRLFASTFSAVVAR